MSLFTAASCADAISLKQILEIEDAPGLTDFRCDQTDIPIWAVVRSAFFRLIMGDLLYSSTGSMEMPVSRSPRRALPGLARAWAHNARARARRSLRSDLLINTEAVGDEWTGTTWFNRYVDPFGDLKTGQAVILLDMFEWNISWPRHNERILYHAPMQTRSALMSRFKTNATDRREASQLVDLLSERAERLLGWTLDERRRESFVAQVAGKRATLGPRYREYAKLLRRVQPKLLLGSSGCYGIHAPLIAAARDVGVVTAEYQHGAISDGHEAYNFAPAIAASDSYRRTLPQFLLTYGDWWNRHIDVPVEKVTIGYPARSAKLQAATAGPLDRRNVLILSDGVEFELYWQLANSLARQLEGTDLQVVVRPHPIERTAVAERHGEGSAAVRIDAQRDIYGAFKLARSVISEVSTGLFEAVGLVERVIMLDTAKARFAYPRHPFHMADSEEVIVALVKADEAPGYAVQPDDLWAPSWRQNYAAFLRERVGDGLC